MKGLIKWVLNHLPRTLLQRIAGWLMPLVGLWYRGNRYACPLCGRTYRKMLPYGYVTSRENALCPHCLSLERHRLLWLYLERETTLFSSL
ncbi:MAG: SAM-dependent methyltransferase, partial [Alistipes sp.]|nr:SAM-dependent methyltransferase [Alistipes sp.]